MAKTKTSPALSTDALKPYVQRAMTDPELREDLLAAFVAARSLYGQMAKGRGVKGKAEKVSEKDFQKQLQTLVERPVGGVRQAPGQGEEEGPQGAEPRHPADGGHARRPLQPVDGRVDARVDHGSRRGRRRRRLEEFEAELDARGRRRRQRQRAVGSVPGSGSRPDPSPSLESPSGPSRARRARARSSTRCRRPRAAPRRVAATWRSPARSARRSVPPRTRCRRRVATRGGSSTARRRRRSPGLPSPRGGSRSGGAASRPRHRPYRRRSRRRLLPGRCDPRRRAASRPRGARSRTRCPTCRAATAGSRRSW